MKVSNFKDMGKVFSAILLSINNIVAGSDKSSYPNDKKDISLTDKEKNKVESGNPEGLRFQDPSEVALLSEKTEERSNQKILKSLVLKTIRLSTDDQWSKNFSWTIVAPFLCIFELYVKKLNA